MTTRMVGYRRILERILPWESENRIHSGEEEEVDLGVSGWSIYEGVGGEKDWKVWNGKLETNGERRCYKTLWPQEDVLLQCIPLYKINLLLLLYYIIIIINIIITSMLLVGKYLDLLKSYFLFFPVIYCCFQHSRY